MMTRTITLLAVLGMLSAPVSAVVVFQDDFAGEPGGAGSDPSSPPPTGLSWTIVEDVPNSEVKIDSEFLVVARGSTATNGASAIANLTAADVTTYTGGVFSTSFDVYKSNASNSAARAQFRPKSGGLDLVSIAFEDDGTVTYFDGAIFVDMGLTYVLATFNQSVVISIDTTTELATVSVNGSTTTGSTDIPFLNSGAMDGFEFTGGKGLFTFLDNIVVDATAIPEPASLALLGLGGLCLLRRRRN